MFKALRWLVLAFFCFGSASAHAAIVLHGLTFGIACGWSNTFPINTCPDEGGLFTAPTYYEDKAEVGGYAAAGVGLPATNELRGMSEFDLTGMSHVSSATLTFSVYRQGGMFNYPEGFDANGDPFTGTILVDAYAGNNDIFGNNFDIFTFENIWSDYEEASIGDIGDLDVIGGDTPSPDVGAVFTFNITGLFNEAIAHDLISLGIRLRQDRTDEEYGLSLAWTFENFQITVTPAPEPTTLALLAVGLAGLGLSFRKWHRTAFALSIAFLGCLAGTPQSLHAATIRIGFEGTVTEVTQPSGVPDPSLFSVGESLSGSYLFDTSTLVTSGSGDSYFYVNTDVVFSVGDKTGSSPIAGSLYGDNTETILGSPARDLFIWLAQQESGLVLSGLGEWYLIDFFIILEDFTNSAVPPPGPGSFLVDPVDVSQFEFNQFLFSFCAGFCPDDHFVVTGTIHSFFIVSVPIPNTLCLFLIGIVGLGFMGWWEKQTALRPVVS